MSYRAFSLTAAGFFLLIALAHVFRIVYGVSFVVQGISLPMWASGAAAAVTGYLAYEGFRLARKSSFRGG
jgi:multisubunit Na+/H+ antiporter MnhC subunit